MDSQDYLLRYGLMDALGRFRSARPLTCRRGDRVVVRTHRGLEVGEVLRATSPGHAHFFPNTSVGPLLRPLGPEDEAVAETARTRGRQLFEDAVGLAGELGLEVIDAEILLDGATGVLYHLHEEECDPRPLVSTLSRAHGLQIILADLTRPAREEHAGCGSCGAGGCGSCGTGGGCGSCGSATPQEVQAHFAELRERMEQRTSLL